MAAVLIPVVVGEDRRLVIDLPATTPLGPADVVLLPRSDNSGAAVHPAREAARAKLLAAGFLVTNLHAPEDAKLLTDEELSEIGRLPYGARPSDDLIAEDRGSY